LAARDRQCDRRGGVPPDGLILASIVVGIGLFTGWKGGEMAFRSRRADRRAAGSRPNHPVGFVNRRRPHGV